MLQIESKNVSFVMNLMVVHGVVQSILQVILRGTDTVAWVGIRTVRFLSALLIGGTVQTRTYSVHCFNGTL